MIHERWFPSRSARRGGPRLSRSIGQMATEGCFPTRSCGDTALARAVRVTAERSGTSTASTRSSRPSKRSEPTPCSLRGEMGTPRGSIRSAIYESFARAQGACPRVLREITETSRGRRLEGNQDRPVMVYPDVHGALSHPVRCTPCATARSGAGGCETPPRSIESPRPARQRKRATERARRSRDRLFRLRGWDTPRRCRLREWPRRG